MPSLIVGTSTAEDALRKEAEKVLEKVREKAEYLSRIEGQLARRGFWLDQMKAEHDWYHARSQWEQAITRRESVLAEIASLARTADYYADQLKDNTVSSVAVATLVHEIAPPIGLFCSTADLAYGEPDQYAPIGWRPQDTVDEPSAE